MIMRRPWRQLLLAAAGYCLVLFTNEAKAVETQALTEMSMMSTALAALTHHPLLEPNPAVDTLVRMERALVHYLAIEEGVPEKLVRQDLIAASSLKAEKRNPFLQKKRVSHPDQYQEDKEE